MANQLVEVKVKHFFDSRKIVNAVERAKLQVFTRMGGRIRLTARRLIRPAGKKGNPSQPGQPPRSHEGSLRKGIAYNVQRSGLDVHNVIIGPVFLNHVHFDSDMFPVRGTVPQVLEFGGALNVVEVWRGDYWGWQRRDLRRRGSVAIVGALRGTTESEAVVEGEYGPIRARKRRINMKARPYMGPALQRNIKAYPREFENTIGKAVIGGG